MISDRINSAAPPPLLSPDAALADSKYLTAEETIRRRQRHVRRLARVYRDHYWALVAELRSKYRDYLWHYGGSPFVSDSVGNAEGEEGGGRCAHSACKQKAMPLTRFCHSHILSDPKQMLYKGCAHVTSRKSTAPTVCGKPILRSITPSFCTYHRQRAEKAVARALKQAGLSNHESIRMAPVIHIIGAACTQEILKKRRALKEAKVNASKMEEDSK